jgi:hypothetical protein
MSVRDFNVDALAAEAPHHDGPYLYNGKEIFINDDFPEMFPYLRTMELQALSEIFSNPQYGPRVVAHLLSKSEDIQRHVLLNYVYVQTAELRKNAQLERQSAQSTIGELTLRLNQLETSLRQNEANRFSSPQRTYDSSSILKIKPSSYAGREKESLRRWFVEIETAMTARKLTSSDHKVAFALSNLSGNARAWGYNLLLADRNAFSDYEVFKQKLAQEFEPPRTLQRAVSEFLDLAQGKRSLHEYIQQMRYLLSCASSDPPSESVKVTHFMRGLRSGHVRDEVYRLAPETFDDAVHYALDAEFNYRQQRADFNPNRGHSNQRHHRPAQSSGPTPMDVSSITASNRPQSNSNGRTGNPVRRPAGTTCNNCGKPGHWSPECRQPKKVRFGSSSSGNAQKGGSGSKNGSSH